jgi:hypothetical protein
MNSLGAGGEEKPYLVNGANALTFCLMVVSCFFSPVLVRYVGIKWALIFGTMGYAPFAAGLYTNNRYGTEWFVLFGAGMFPFLPCPVHPPHNQFHEIGKMDS